jgi:hypothetical protein
MIECSFIPIKKSQYTTDEEVRDGLYSSSVYAFEEFGVSKWVFCAYLKVDHKKYFDEGMSSKQLIDSCLDFLNYVPEPARKTKKSQKTKYGKIKPTKALPTSVPPQWPLPPVCGGSSFASCP